MSGRTRRISSPAAERSDVYARVTAQVIEQLEQGVRPWAKPWNAGHLAGRITRPLRANGLPYRGINVILLWLAATAKGYAAPFWMTYRQAAELGGQVRKGEKAAAVTYADKLRRTRTDEATGEDEEREVYFHKQYPVFNVEQINGLPERFHATAAPRISPRARIGRAEAFFAALGADIRHGGDSAGYAEGADQVRMPPFESFRDPESYYATLAHECVHWTKHVERLARDFGRRRWGDAGYAREELVAEIGASFLAADLGLYIEPREDHAAYLAHWLRVLGEDKRAIFNAAGHAERAVAYLHGRQPAAEAADGSGAAEEGEEAADEPLRLAA